MKFAKLDFQKNPNIGLFSFASDKFCLVNRFIQKKDVNLIKNVLKVKVYQTSVLGTGLIGIFTAGNSQGIVISDRIYSEEIEEMQRNFDVLVLETRHTAFGNLILSNDKGCIVSRDLEKFRKDIRDFLGVETRVGTIGGMDLVGSLAICNSKGCLVHKWAKEKEKKFIERILDVLVSPGSVNFGNPWVKSGLIVNSKGFLAGDQTSGPELGIASETFGFV
ncbi:MAG: translation initiation factor IF-6 [Candidatus Aenigmatarchaeota archaeon]|nr:MAG: translation initiation factor IF-6 [Candidatus Aenigmarchaeota archaeon]